MTGTQRWPGRTGQPPSRSGRSARRSLPRAGWCRPSLPGAWMTRWPFAASRVLEAISVASCLKRELAPTLKIVPRERRHRDQRRHEDRHRDHDLDEGESRLAHRTPVTSQPRRGDVVEPVRNTGAPGAAGRCARARRGLRLLWSQYSSRCRHSLTPRGAFGHSLPPGGTKRQSSRQIQPKFHLCFRHPPEWG